MDEKCMICLENLFDSEGDATKPVQQLNCKHMFHKECLAGADLTKGCPLCRTEITSKTLVEHAGNAAPIERLPDMGNSSYNSLKSRANRYNRYNDYEDFVFSVAGKKYTIDRARLRRNYNEIHPPAAAGGARKTRKHRVKRRKTRRT